MKKYLFINVIALTMIGCGGGGGDSKTTPASSTAAASSMAAASSTAVSSSAAASSAVPAAWALVWSDEFTGTNLDTTKWSFEKNCYGGGNNELQCYTDRADNAFLADGNLHIVAKKETFAGQAKGDDDPAYNAADTSQSRDYTSARLRSKSKGDWTYGRMEIRAKLPQGQGMWPAIWMLPTDAIYGGWPSSGEIDIMEAVNSGGIQYGNKVHGTLHYGTPWTYEGISYTPATNVWDEFHTYAIEWEAGTIRWYVDDIHYMTQTAKAWFTNGSVVDNAPFDQKFHLLLNLAVGGKWPGSPDLNTLFPQEMTVDYVRVYNCNVDTVTGLGCATHVDPAIKVTPSPSGTLADTFIIYDNAVNPIWDVGIFSWNSGSGAIVTSEVDSDDTARGKVIDIKYSNPSGVAYIQSKTIKDASAFSTGGNLVFDVKVLNYGSATGLIVKADCVDPCSSGDILIPNGKVADGVWQTITIPISTFVTGVGGKQLNLSKLNTPFVIFPTWGSQAGVELQVDNVKWVK